MKALSIKEPWATEIRDKGKRIETRTWKTNYRGKLLLCASKKPEGRYSGMSFGTADLVDCRTMTKEDEALAHCEIYENAHSWVLENFKLIKPFPVKGHLSIFNVEVDALWEECPECKGSNFYYIIDDNCPRCAGNGTIDLVKQ